MKLSKVRFRLNFKLTVAYLVLAALASLTVYLGYDMFRGKVKENTDAASRRAEQQRKNIQPQDEKLTGILKRLKDRNSPGTQKIGNTVPVSQSEKKNIVKEEEGPLAEELKRAIALYESRSYSRAAKIFEYIVKSDPVSREAREASYFLGLFSHKRGDLLMARKYFERSHKLSPSDPLVNYNFGVVLYSLREYRAALEKFQTAVRADPENPQYLLSLGKTWYQLGDYDNAFIRLTEAEKLDTDNPKIMYYRAVSASKSSSRVPIAIEIFNRLTELAPREFEGKKALENLAELYLKNGKTEKSISAMKKAISLDPHNFDYLYNLGQLYLDQQDLEQANKYFKLASEVQPKNVSVWQNIAGIQYRRGFLESALGAVLRALELEPLNIRMVLLKAYILDSQMKYDPARAEYLKVISLDPQAPESRKAHLNLGVIYERDGDILKALEHYLKADPEDPLTHFNLAAVYEKQGLYQKAVEEYRRAVDLDRKNGYYRYSLAKMYFRLQMYLEAMKELESARETGYDSFDFSMLLAEVYSKLNKNEEAIAVYDRLLESEKSVPHLVKILNNKGILYDRLGLYDRAVRTLEIALDKDPNNAAVYHNLGIVNAHMKDYTSAVRMFKRSLQLDRTNKEAHLDLADIYFVIGLYEDAKKEYQAALDLDASSLEAQIGMRKIREAVR